MAIELTQIDFLGLSRERSLSRPYCSGMPVFHSLSPPSHIMNALTLIVVNDNIIHSA
ncbi:MAG TPA: hypothetical protein VI077_06050 [Pseudolabrys sp.]